MDFFPEARLLTGVTDTEPIYTTALKQFITVVTTVEAQDTLPIQSSKHFQSVISCLV